MLLYAALACRDPNSLKEYFNEIKQQKKNWLKETLQQSGSNEELGSKIQSMPDSDSDDEISD